VTGSAWLDDAVASGAVTLTANRRLARHLSVEYGERRLAAGRTSWRSPPVHYWRDWLDSRLQAAADPCALPTRLDGLSSTILWERCLAARMPGSLLGFGGVVRQALQAWQRLADWNVPLTAVLASARTDDEKRFARAAADYRDLLDAGNWIDAAGLPDVVADLCRVDPSVVPSRLVLAGFDRLTPAARRVTDALEASGCEVAARGTGRIRASALVAAFDDPDAELRAAGAWAAGRLAASPAARVAIVCPALETDAARAGALIRDGLAPGWQWGGPAHRGVLNLSFGRRLADYPAVAAALLLLQWTVRGLRGHELGLLMRSPYLGLHDGAERGRLDLALRRWPDRDWTATAFLGLAASSGDALRPFVPVAREVEAFAGRAALPLAPARCAEAVDTLLAAAGWPGPAPLDSDGFQLVNRWRGLLNEFARASSVVDELPASEAIGRLTSLAGDTVWQPEGQDGVVEVLGTLEAAGMEFDSLWVAGLDASQWPAVARPVAFLARSLQAAFDMPDATPQASLEHARLVTDRLIASAGTCVLSWPRARDEAEMSASPLLDGLDLAPYGGPVDPGWSARRISGVAAMEEVQGDNAPPVAADEVVRGGAYTVQKQRTEPFRAFAEGRLGISAPDPFQPGLAPSLRGSIIHAALYNLMSDRPDLAVIRSWTTAERRRRTGAAIDAALSPHQASADEVTSRIIGIERERVRNMLEAVLDVEVERPPFQVEQIEASLDFERCGLRLALRVDRIDRLADGRRVIIDYKTGLEKSFATPAGELRDAQLVVYAGAVAGEIGALAIVNVDSRKVSWKVAGGLGEVPDTEWPERLGRWQDEVDDALRRLVAGDARINVLQSAADSRAHAILSRAEAEKRAD